MLLTRRELLALGATVVAGGAASRLIGGVERLPSLQSSGTTGFVPDVDLELTAEPGSAAVLPGSPTAVWRFVGKVLTGPSSSLDAMRGSWLGPTIRLRRGQKVRIRFRNRIPDPSIVHWHGLDVPQAADGHPRLAVPGGADYVYEFVVNNRAGTYWYHPHPHMQTGRQVYAGMAGAIVVSDDEESALGLPSGDADLIWVLQDRRFDTGNQLVYSAGMMDGMTGFLGDRVLVNGRIHPTWSLASRAYRVRVINASNARIYKLAWADGTPMTVIGTDGGLLERPVSRRAVTLAPAQRVELWLDLTDRAVGSSLELRSEAFPVADGGLEMGGGGRGMGGGMGGQGPGMGGTGPGRGGQGPGMGGMGASASELPMGAPFSVLSITVAARAASVARLPDRLTTFAKEWQLDPGAPARVPRDAVAAGRPDLRDGRGFRVRDRAGRRHPRVGVLERRRPDGDADGASDPCSRSPVPHRRAFRRQPGQHPPGGAGRWRLDRYRPRAA